MEIILSVGHTSDFILVVDMNHDVIKPDRTAIFGIYAARDASRCSS
ncbi:hypothetical protein AT1219_11133 [Vibrio alginolyticus]|nr:hypothetical protein VDIAB_100329 [Vibrio diabolicus]